MKVQCGQCPAKYAVSDDRIRDKKVRIRCRRCNAAIVVDGKTDPPLVTSTPARRSVGPTSSIPAPSLGPPESAPNASADSFPRPVAHTILGGLEAPHTAEQFVVEQLVNARLNAAKSVRKDSYGDGDANGAPEPRRGMPAPNRGLTDPPAGSNADRWRVALTQQDLRWMTTEEITLAFRDGAVKLETFVFRTGMPTWLTLLEVGEISRALSDAGLVTIAPSPVEESANDTVARDPSPAPQRVSSLPPPRRPGRNASLAANAEGESEDVALDSDESMPFALVSGRTSAAKRGAEAPSPDNDVVALPSVAAEAAQFTTLARLPEEAPTAAAGGASLSAGASASSSEAFSEAPPGESKAPGEPAIAVRELSFERPPEIPGAVDAEGATDPEAAALAARGLAEPPQGTHLWIWLLLAVVFVAAAALLLGPRFGLRLL